MIEKLIKTVIAGVLFYVVYIVLTLVINELGLPAIAITLVAVLLILAFLLFLYRTFRGELNV